MAAEVTAKSQTSSIKIRQIVRQAVVLQNSTSLEMDLHDQELVSYQRALNFLKVKEPEIGLMYSSRRNPLNSLTSRHINDEGKDALTLIIEAGVSESYQQLKKDVKLWLNQLECPTAMIIFLTENPSFRSPTNEGNGNNTCSVTERGLFESAMANTSRVRPFGPYCFRGHAWFGTMATATIEEVVLNGRMMEESDRLDLGLTIGDAFPLNHVAIEDIRAEPVLLATHLVQKILAAGARNTAKTRFYNSFKE
ncbi:hypothetical protein V1522DRAFT_423946 [Lipomyces starkeyi]